MRTVKIEQFEGPLELLLQLIEQKELDVSRVALSEVTEQYIEYLNQVQEVNPEELADFLVVAAKLLLIKSKILIPTLEVDEDESDLEKQLRIYKEYYDASKVINKMLLRRKYLYPRDKPAVALEPIFNPPSTLTDERLKDLFLGVIRAIEPIVSLPREVYYRTISIQEKIAALREHIQREATLNFHHMIKTSKDKTEVIVTFLALLELVKQRMVVVVQDNIFADIEIKRV